MSEGDSPEHLLADRLEFIDRFSPPDALSRCYTYLARQGLDNDMPYEAERLLEHAQRLAVSRGWQRLQAMLLAEQVRVRCSAAISPAQSNCSDSLNKWPPASEWMPNIPANAPSLCLHPLASRLLLARGRAPQACVLLAEMVSDQENRGTG